MIKPNYVRTLRNIYGEGNKAVGKYVRWGYSSIQVSFQFTCISSNVGQIYVPNLALKLYPNFIYLGNEALTGLLRSSTTRKIWILQPKLLCGFIKVFYWAWKVSRFLLVVFNCACVIGFGKSRHRLNQSDMKPTPAANWPLTFSRASGRLFAKF